MLSSCKEAMDPRLLRNERDSASMPSNKREEINRKRRESYQRKKEQKGALHEPNNGCTTYILPNTYIQCISYYSFIIVWNIFLGGESSRNKENEDPANYGKWLNANDSCLHYSVSKDITF